MDIPLALQIVEIIFAVSVLGYGIFEHYKRQKLEQFSKATLQGMAGNIAKIQQSTAWASTNLRDAHNPLQEICTAGSVGGARE